MIRTAVFALLTFASAAFAQDADHVAAIRDADALARKGSLGIDAVLARMPAYAALRNRDVAQSMIAMLGDVRPLVAEESRRDWERYANRLFGLYARQLGFTPQQDDSEDTLRLRPALIEFVALHGNDPALHAQAKQLALRWLGDRTSMDANMAETVLQAAARRGNREYFEQLRAAVAAAADRRDRRILYVALGSFQDPALARSALELILDPAPDYREVFQIAWTQSNTPQGAARSFAFVKANFDALVARAPRDAAASYPWLAGGLCSEPDREEVERFFRDRSPRFTGGPRILAQVLERISLCSAFKDRQQARLTDYLRKQ